MRAILVPVADRPECAHALRAAFELARHLSANVLGYHLRPHDIETRRKRSTAPRGSRGLAGRVHYAAVDGIAFDSKAARKFFAERVAQFGFVEAKRARYREEGGLALWHEIKGDPERVFSIIGPASDLIVVTRPRKRSSFRAQAFMHGALMCSGRPVMVLGNRRVAQIGQRVLIAWNQSAEAAAAVTAALPLLQRADEVVLLTSGAPDGLGPSATQMQQYLRFWDIKAKCVRTPGKGAGAEIAQAFARHDSDLLVMGAYSRAHWREAVFGGVTNHILSNTTIPTLMLHR